MSTLLASAAKLQACGNAMLELVQKEPTPEHRAQAAGVYALVVEVLIDMTPLHEPSSREWSLVRTKLEEASMWLSRALEPKE